MTGSLARTLDDAGNSRLEADVTNIDFAAVLPFIDDPTSLAALRGAGALSIDVNFEPAAGKLVDGRFKIDLTGLDLRISADRRSVVWGKSVSVRVDLGGGRTIKKKKKKRKNR